MFAVFGYPVNHSLSDKVHKSFAKEIGKDIQYLKISSKQESFKNNLANFILEGGEGANITSPLKSIAFSMADYTHESAKLARAANTLCFIKNKLHAYNTDGLGFINDLKSKEISLLNSRVVILGSGGSVSGILPIIMQKNVLSVTIVCRDPSKALNSFADNITHKVKIIKFSDMEKNINFSVDLLINTLPRSVIDKYSYLSKIINCSVFYDLNYTDSNSLTKNFARKKPNIKIYDGLGMLVEQAAESFNIWHNCTLTRVVIEDTKRSLLNNL